MDRPIDEIRELMEAETWYTGEESVEAGFANRLITAAPPEEDGAEASARDLSGFRNPPAELAGELDPPPVAEAESAADADALVELMKRRLRLQELDE
jgi:hypothetical protein